MNPKYGLLVSLLNMYKYFHNAVMRERIDSPLPASAEDSQERLNLVPRTVRGVATTDCPGDEDESAWSFLQYKAENGISDIWLPMN